MTTRLSELLERLRPTGTPGAATEGAGEREASERQHEIADVAAVLVTFQAEADAIVADAHRRAADIHRQALDEVRRIDDGVPDRVATASSSAEHRSHADTMAAQHRIMTHARADAERVRHISDAEIAHISDAATALVWAALDTGATVSASVTSTAERMVD